MAEKYKITKHIATISQGDDGSTFELNMIRWKGRAEKYDLRRWERNDDGNRVMLRGVSFSQAEFDMLCGVLCKKMIDEVELDIDEVK